ncbi:hypothetical protein [Parendozoicomonas haliclonae]|uniref:hypothetical protein n=1 Tax=Parendozoicomonas haliclonae TaxID=1960125 RepID=UPI000B3561CA
MKTSSNHPSRSALSSVSELLCIALILAISAEGSFASEESWDEWGDDSWDDIAESSAPLFTGFIEASYGRRLQTDPVLPHHTTLSEFRGRLEYEYQHDSFTVEAQGDVVYDDVMAETDWQTRRLMVRFSPTENTDVKLGRQVLTWGTGDYLFLNDLFPKDWQSFFSGREDEYLKAPSDAVMVSWYNNTWLDSELSLDMIWQPEFTPDISLTGERFSLFSPEQGGNTAPKNGLNPDEPSGDVWSARLATTIHGTEYALYGHQGYWPVPRGINAQRRMTYPELDVWGASLRTPVGSGLINTELAWYDSREDRSGDDPMIPNSQLRWLVGYEQEVATNLTAAVQYYLEWTHDHDELLKHSMARQFEPEEYQQLLTLRLTQMTMNQKLTLSLFTFWSPTDEDAYLRPSVSYRLDDNWQLAAGMNLFAGNESHTFFGQYEDASNAWLRVRYNY